MEAYSTELQTKKKDYGHPAKPEPNLRMASRPHALQ